MAVTETKSAIETSRILPLEEKSQALVAVAREIKLVAVRNGNAPLEHADFIPAVSHSYFNLKLLGLMAAILLGISLYLFTIASDVYVSETRFIVQTAARVIPDGAGSAMGQGISHAPPEAHVISEYIQSRDILRKLETDVDIRNKYSRDSVDFLSRYPLPFFTPSEEGFFKFYNNHVESKVESDSGMNIVRVKAFAPDDAELIAKTIVSLSEDFINQVNKRALEDAVGYSDKLVERAWKNFVETENRLTAFRTSSGIIDPSRDTANAMDELSKLTTALAQVQVQINQQTSVTPNHPDLHFLRQRASSYQTEINRKKQEIAGPDSSIATKLSNYERLVLDRELASQLLINSEQTREKTRQEIERKHLYLQVVVHPNNPDMYSYPLRKLDFMISSLVLGLAYLFLVSVRRLMEERAA